MTPAESQDLDLGSGTNRLNLELKRMLRDGTEALASFDADDRTDSSDSDEARSGSESESGETGDADRLSGLLRSLQRLTRLLMETCPTLEQTLQHVLNPTKAIKVEPSGLQISDTAERYEQKVHENSLDSEASSKGLLKAVERYIRRMGSEEENSANQKVQGSRAKKAKIATACRTCKVDFPQISPNWPFTGFLTSSGSITVL